MARLFIYQSTRNFDQTIINISNVKDLTIMKHLVSIFIVANMLRDCIKTADRIEA